MDAQKVTVAELDLRIARLEAFIKQNPYSSTDEKEQLEDLKKQRTNLQRNEDILY